VLQDREDAPGDVTVFTTRRAFDADDDSPFEGATLLYEEDLFTLSTYQRAREAYRAISVDVEALCRDFDLSPRDQRTTRQYFKKYCLDSVLFQSVLNLTRPDVLYAVQFTSNRGYLDAIRSWEAGETPTNVVIQHGAFRDSIMHPFVGADRALLWGEYFESTLAGINTVPQPGKIHLVGDPNLQNQLARYGKADGGIINSPSTIAYVSTLVEHSADAIRLFATVVNERSDVEVVYKPHPSGEVKKYHSLLEDGLIREAQIERQRNVYSLIFESDVIVGTETTALPEAVAFDVPTVQLLPGRGWSDWTKHGLCGVSTVEELNEIISRLVADPGAREALLNEERPLAKRMFDDLETANETIAAFVSDLS